MKNFLLCTAVIYLSTYAARGAEVNTPCGNDGWIPYKDDKCIKLFKSFETRKRAEDVCRREHSVGDPFAPSLVSIRSFDEQKFVTEYVFNSSDSNHIWIGAERLLESSTEFVWADGSPVQRFTYWDVNRPTDESRRSCVLLQSSLSSRLVSDLRWIDVTCNTGNWFICEKLQAWPIERFQQAILSIRRDMQYKVDSFVKQNADLVKTIDDLRNNLTSQATTLAAQAITLTSQASTLTSQATTITTQGTQLRNLQENPVPIGFVYVQLSGQPEPQNVWTTVRWTEITSTYAGLFFRAAGGNAAGFGSTQAENSPRFTNVWRTTGTAVSAAGNIPIGLGQWSVWISTGTVTGSHSGFSLANTFAMMETMMNEVSHTFKLPKISLVTCNMACPAQTNLPLEQVDIKDKLLMLCGYAFNLNFHF